MGMRRHGTVICRLLVMELRRWLVIRQSASPPSADPDCSTRNQFSEDGGKTIWLAAEVSQPQGSLDSLSNGTVVVGQGDRPAPVC